MTLMHYIEKIEFGGWKNCCRISNGLVEIIITADVGPRIIRFGFIGQENEFKVFPEMLGINGGEEWRIYGGHRFWVAPEDPVTTYYPDNEPVQIEEKGNRLHMIQKADPRGLQKEIILEMSPDQAHVTLTHRLRNSGFTSLEAAPWALSVMAQGGQAIIPFPKKGAHPQDLLPNNRLILWPYTDMTDPRWHWGKKFIRLDQDPKNPVAQKLGFYSNEKLWMAYARGDHLFVKTIDNSAEITYPDLGSSVEIFTNDQFLEMETLGELVTLIPGEVVEHVEQWYLFDQVQLSDDEDQIEKLVLLDL
jgi:hypothetical protein